MAVGKTQELSLEKGRRLLQLVRETIGYAKDEATQVALFLNDHRRSPEVGPLCALSLSKGI